MLQEELVRKIRELLLAGEYSQRAISRMTGASRVVIHRIATGKRKERQERPKEEWEEDWSGKPYERCPSCGCLVRLPCLACIIRKLSEKNAKMNYGGNNVNGLGVDLEERHRVRYEQVKAWREAQKDPDFVEVPENWPFRKRWKNDLSKKHKRGKVAEDIDVVRPKSDGMNAW